MEESESSPARPARPVPAALPVATGAPEAIALREALRRGETSALALTEAALARAEATVGLGAFVSLNHELALAEAEAADRALEATVYTLRAALPPLLGVPTAHKDLLEVRGTVTTHGSRAVPHTTATVDSAVAELAREAGAISIGKTQVPEFGIAGYSENEIAPPARNPHDPSRTAGGSSGGTAAAIAAGVIPAAIASDSGGSIRIPAAACGLIGLKPGRHTMPADQQRGDFDENGAPRMGVSGPMARTVRDAALFFDAMRPDDPSTLPGVERVLADPGRLPGLRIGVSLASPFEGWCDVRFDSATRNALDLAASALDDSGHLVSDARITYDPRYPEAFTDTWTQSLARVPLTPAAEQRLGALAQMFLARARHTSPMRVVEAAEALRDFVADTLNQWNDYDVVLTPALAYAAPEVGAFRALGPEGDYRLQCEWAPQTSMVNVVGSPALTLPVAHIDGMPYGVQLIGREGTESLLLELAAQLSVRTS